MADAPTAKQREAYERRRAGETWKAIGDSLGIGEGAVRVRVERAIKKGLPPLFGEFKHERGMLPAGQGLFDKARFDMKVFTELAASAGIPPRLAAALGRRVEGQFGAVKAEMKAMTVAEQVAATHEKALMILAHIDEVSVGQASAKDLAIAYGILVDKGLLLGGKPTQIFDFNLRSTLQVLMPQFLAEAKRRGITIEGEFHADQPAGHLIGTESGAGYSRPAEVAVRGRDGLHEDEPDRQREGAVHPGK